MKHNSTSERETLKIAKDFVEKLRGGEIILLSGNLGAGKTVFVKGLAKALGIKDIVKSPTFNLMKCYEVEKSESLDTKDIKHLCHVDVYRLENVDDLMDIGIEDYISDDTVIVIEWADKIEKLEKLGQRIIKIKINHGKEKNKRVIHIE